MENTKDLPWLSNIIVSLVFVELGDRTMPTPYLIF